MVIATHDFRNARRWCNRAIRLEAGRIVADGPVEEVLGSTRATAAAPPSPPALEAEQAGTDTTNSGATN
jgi:lipopolysaccharide transport system ATP-binding protein